WYRRSFSAPALERGQRLVLHFGAVDYHASVWLNGVRLGEHERGYAPFSFDITDYLDPSVTEQQLIVRADDDPTDLEKPRGKQDWQLNPHSIWYPRTTGIWQTVWTEVVPAVRIDRLVWTSSLERWECGLAAWILCEGPDCGLKVSVSLACGDKLLARD